MNVAPFSNINSESNHTNSVVAIQSELVRGSESEILRELLPRVKQESVALDLSGVDRIDAAGIASLITLYCTAVEAGRDFSIVSPSAHVLDLLRVVGLERILVAGCQAGSLDRSGCPDGPLVLSAA